MELGDQGRVMIMENEYRILLKILFKIDKNQKYSSIESIIIGEIF
jgi:hypothetical protein